VHFECPADLSSLAASDHHDQSKLAATSTSVDHSNSVQQMDTGGTAQPADVVSAASQAAMPHHLRLQGLRRSDSHDDDASGVDHGDGYGVGLPHRNHSPPSDAT